MSERHLKSTGNVEDRLSLRDNCTVADRRGLQVFAIRYPNLFTLLALELKRDRANPGSKRGMLKANANPPTHERGPWRSQILFCVRSHLVFVTKIRQTRHSTERASSVTAMLAMLVKAPYLWKPARVVLKVNDKKTCFFFLHSHMCVLSCSARSNTVPNHANARAGLLAL